MIFKKALCLVILFPSVMLYAQSKTLYQFLENWPAGYDSTGTHWVVYNLYRAETHFVTDTSVSSQTTTTLWMAQVGNFNGGVDPWHAGDTLIALGSIDTAYISDPAGYGNNPNHCGFYWLFGDTIDASTPEQWEPADTIRPLPQPIAAQVGTDIEISITNPAETTSDINIYDVLGYWIWADTTGSGKPDSFDIEVAFVPVDGIAGQTTLYSHPIAGNYAIGQTVYWAYKLVARPDTTLAENPDSPGYSTYYFSQNSNSIVIVGIEEEQVLTPEPEIPFLEIHPNPFQHKTDITLRSAECGVRNENVSLRIFDAAGRMVRQWDYSTIGLSDKVSWYGEDDFERQVPEGVYLIRLTTPDKTITKKIIRLK